MELCTQCWSDYRAELSNFVRGRVSNPYDADDLVQEILYKAYTRGDQLQDTSNVRAWLYRIARNSITDYYRRNATQPKAVEVPEILSISTDDTPEIADCVVQMFTQLDEPYQQALLAADVDEVPQNHLSEQLQMSYSGIKSRVQRGRKQLRHLLEQNCTTEVREYQHKTLIKDERVCCAV